MPSSNLAAYLAKNYLTASKPNTNSDPNEPPKKKRKKSKHQHTTTGLIIADDDEDLSLSARNGANEDEEPDFPTMYESKVRSAEFRKAKKNAWQPLTVTGEEDALNTGTGAGGRRGDGYGDSDGDEADTLLRTAQSDEARRLAEQEAENAPAVVETDTASGIRMESGIRAGLQTAADTARIIAEQEAREEAERKALRRANKNKKKTTTGEDDNEGGTIIPREEETIYRDATGRRIDVSLRRAEARKEEAEKARAKKQEKLDAMGDVQRREREEKLKDLDEAKFLTLGRSVDDEEYNERLKGQVRWDDPMAAYMAEKRAEEDSAAGGRGRGKGDAGGEDGSVRSRRRKEYQGPAPPNRYGIKPGWRWDGVDRGNGFEKEWFQARSKRSRNEKLSYEWQMDE